MNLYSNYFREFLFGFLSQVETINDIEQEGFRARIDDELKKISPYKSNPFSFFTWFFEAPNKTSHPVSLPNGQKMFIEFFKTISTSYTRPYPPISYNFSADRLTLTIIHCNNPDDEDYSPITTIFYFKEVLVELFREEISRSISFLERVSQDYSVYERRIEMKAIEENIVMLNRIRQADEYDQIFQRCFIKFKDYIKQRIWDLTPSLPLTTLQNKIEEITHTEVTRVQILKAMCDKFSIDGRNVIRIKSDFISLVSLFIKHDYNSKVYFKCSGREVGYILKKLKNYGILIENVAKCGKVGCIHNWEEDESGSEDLYKPMSESHIRQVMKDNGKPPKTYLLIDEFFASINFSD